MIDREKVIKGLECCEKDEDFFICGECPYIEDKFGFDCLRKMCRDALAMLKEQEPVKPKRMNHSERASFDNYLCECKTELYYKQKFCDDCGRPVKWD